jgi:hypothetical protein
MENRRKMEEVIGRWRKAHNAKFHNLYSSSNIIPLIKLTNGQDIHNLVRNPEDIALQTYTKI